MPAHYAHPARRPFVPLAPRPAWGLWRLVVWPLLALLLPAGAARAAAGQGQTITFPGLGTYDFVLGYAIPVAATASSGLPVSLSSSNPAVVAVVGGQLRVTGIGSATITATQGGDAQYNPAAPVVRPLTVRSLGLEVQYADGDGGNLTNKVIRPYWQLVNNGRTSFSYTDLTVRYWLTVEDNDGLNAQITYVAATGGTAKVQAAYWPLPQTVLPPRAGVTGYVEYSFRPVGNATLAGGSSSGPVYSQLNSPSWTDLNEADDYSYRPGSRFAPNDHITLYWQGRLIWGTEPPVTASVLQARVISASADYNPVSQAITATLNLRNEGNQVLYYYDLSMRYWFTPDGATGLRFSSDYAKLGSAAISGQLGVVSPARPGASAYLELRVDPSLGRLWPLGSTGDIRFRILKASPAPFYETDDYSYLPPGPLAANPHITVYYRGQLIWGTEPPAAPAAALRVAARANPLVDEQAELTISGSTSGQLLVLAVYDLYGQPLLQQQLATPTAEQSQMVSLQGRPAGIYLVRVSDDQQVSTVRLVKP